MGAYAPGAGHRVVRASLPARRDSLTAPPRATAKCAARSALGRFVDPGPCSSYASSTSFEAAALSAERVALIPTRAECEAVWLPADEGRWLAYQGGDDLDQPAELVVYCPECAQSGSWAGSASAP
jgi:hypothetical protein